MEHAAHRLCHPGAPCRIIAHRGYSSAYAENSLEAYEQAIAAGADFVEIDLRPTSDGGIVCHHDATTGGFSISKLTTAELAERGIVSLAAVLPKLFDRVGLVFDLKVEAIGLAADALALLRRNTMLAQAVIGVRSLGQAEYVRAISPESVVLGLLNEPGSVRDFYGIGGHIIRLWEEDCDADRLASIRRQNRLVWITAGRRSANGRPGDIDMQGLKRLFQLNVDGILVNDPQQAIRARQAFENQAVTP